MAVELSTRYIKDHISFPRHAQLHLLCRLHRPLKAVRKVQRHFIPPPPATAVPPCQITERFEATQEHFQQHRWAYAEQILDPNFHAALIRSWPPRRYFDEPPLTMDKSYDIGFRWGLSRPAPLFVDAFPAVQTFTSFLRSEALAQRVGHYYGRPMHCYSFLLTHSYPGSSVVPHKDTVFQCDDVPAMINMAFFINGTGGQRSGGLAILRDNAFLDTIFEPTNLRNSLLLYDSKAPFFHGFRPIQCGKFRWAIFAQFKGHSTVQGSESAYQKDLGALVQGSRFSLDFARDKKAPGTVLPLNLQP